MMGHVCCVLCGVTAKLSHSAQQVRVDCSMGGGRLRSGLVYPLTAESVGVQELRACRSRVGGVWCLIPTVLQDQHLTVHIHLKGSVNSGASTI